MAPLTPYGQGSCICSAHNTGDEFAASGSGWDSLSIRHAFIRKVKHTLSQKLDKLAPLCFSCITITFGHKAKEFFSLSVCSDKEGGLGYENM